MKIRDLIKLYEEKRALYGNDTYKHISELLREAKKNSLPRLVKKAYTKWRPRAILEGF